jgi:hypothetical protein
LPPALPAIVPVKSRSLVRRTDSSCRSTSLAKPQASNRASGKNLLEDVQALTLAGQLAFPAAID